MSNKASAQRADNASLFSLIQQPVKRTSAKSPRRGAASEHKAAAGAADTSEIPHWAMVPPVQLYIRYADRHGEPQRHHVVPWNDSKTQDIELSRSIKEILRSGGRNLTMDVIHVPTGLCVSRWRVG